MSEAESVRWIDQVREEHRHLAKLEMELEGFLTGARPALADAAAGEWADELIGKLERFHDELVRHFRYEEVGGMVEELLVAHPRATGEVDRIVADHAEILIELKAVVGATREYAEGLEPANPALRRRVIDLLEHLRRHERDETDLIVRLENRDSAASD